MRKINILAACMFGLAALSVTSCSDPADEITSLVYDRNFSPTDIETSGVTEETATISWNASSGATSYNLEVFADDSLTFEGNPAQTITGITGTECSISGLVYDTKYSVRVQAITENDESRTSKWHGVYFKTDAQQIFTTPTENDIADRSVIMSWPAGEEVTKIVATDADGNIITTVELSAEEIAAGKAEITGLSPETTYTINLYNGEKERGNKKVTTIADLDGATVVRPEDDLGALLEAAKDGDVFALYGGTHVIKHEAEDESDATTAGSVAISKSITIKGIYPTNVPIINGRFELKDGAGLSISQVVLDGTGTSGDQAFNFKGTTECGALDVQNCEIKNYVKGVFYHATTTYIPSITFNNCLIHDITCEGGDMFDSRDKKGYLEALTITNSTIYNSASARDIIRIDDNSGTWAGKTTTVKVDHCTFDNVGQSSNKRYLYVRFQSNVITWSNNLITNTKSVYSNQSKTSMPEYSNNAYYEASSLQTSDVANKVNSDGKREFADKDGTTLTASPYANTTEGDFTLTESASKLGVGDPRWYE